MKENQKSQNNLEMKNKIRRLILPGFKIYYKAEAIKIVTGTIYHRNYWLLNPLLSSED